MDAHGSIGDFFALIDFLDKHDPSLCRGMNYVLLIFAGDSGVSLENISTYQPLSSWRIVEKHLNGSAYTSLLFARIGREEILIDVGLYHDLPEKQTLSNFCSINHDICSSSLIDMKVARGTRNSRNEKALEFSQLVRAIEAGRSAVAAVAQKGYNVLGLAEIGVGNTIGAYSIIARLFGIPPVMVVGPGSDRTGRLWQRRLQVVEEVYERMLSLPKEVLGLLQEAGSLEIAALTGAVLEASKRGMIIVLDGMIASTAALIARRLNPGCGHYLLSSLKTEEPGQKFVLSELQLLPMIGSGLNYGEGLGAGWGLFLLEMAYRFKIRQDSCDYYEN